MMSTLAVFGRPVSDLSLVVCWPIGHTFTSICKHKDGVIIEMSTLVMLKDHWRARSCMSPWHVTSWHSKAGQLRGSSIQLEEHRQSKGLHWSGYKPLSALCPMQAKPHLVTHVLRLLHATALSPALPCLISMVFGRSLQPIKLSSRK